LDYGRTLLAWGLGDGEVLFPTWGTDLAPLQHLLRVARAGVDLGMSGRDSSRDYPLQTYLLREHRVSLRQTVASIGTLVIYLIATKDGFISRVFLFNFVPCFYLALLFSHHYLPPFLARRFFKGIRREKKVVGWFTGTSGATA
jgi:hypothetical protein